MRVAVLRGGPGDGQHVTVLGDQYVLAVYPPLGPLSLDPQEQEITVERHSYAYAERNLNLDADVFEYRGRVG